MLGEIEIELVWLRSCIRRQRVEDAMASASRLYWMGAMQIARKHGLKDPETRADAKRVYNMFWVRL